MEEFAPTKDQSDKFFWHKAKRAMAGIALVLTTTACGGNESPKTIPPTPTIEEQAVPVSTATETPTEVSTPDALTTITQNVLESLTQEDASSNTEENLQLICPQDDADHPECSNNPNAD